MKKFLLLILFLVMPAELAAEEGNAMSSLPYFKQGAGARSAGMGNTGTALAMDATAAYWNPAGLAVFSPYRILTYAMYYRSSLDRKSGYISIAENLFGQGLGISWNYFGISGIEGRNDAGDFTGGLESQSHCIGISYGRRLWQEVLAGATAKYFRCILAGSKAYGFGFDAGMLYQQAEFNLGLNIQDINTGICWDTGRKDEVMPTLRLGTAYQVIYETITSAFDIEMTLHKRTRCHFGLECRVVEFCCLRGGWDGNFTAGIGFEVKNYCLDYAFTFDRYGVGNFHRIGLRADFGNSDKQKNGSKETDNTGE